MAEGQSVRGELTTTPRSIQQDAESAMGSDPVRAIVELVTNADDAYEGVVNNRKGKIRIEWEPRRQRPTVLRVRDRARGMTQAEMVERLGILGGRTSGFEDGAQRRGLFGRGAKDVVHFGPVRWESKRDGEHTRFEIEYDAGATNRHVRTELPAVAPNDAGTTVTLEIQPRFRIPRETTLMENLKRHYALRPMLEDRRGRELTLNDKKIVYEPPRGEILADREKWDTTGHDGQECIVTIWECAQPLDDNQAKEYWRHSLLIKSGRAAYEIFQGGQFSRSPLIPYLSRLFGTVEVPGINDLIRQYDDYIEHGQSPPRHNPIRLVRRDRDGLVNREDHPFVDALYKAIESALQPHLERLREEAERGTGARISESQRRKLDRVGRVLAEYLEETDEEGLIGSGNLPEVGLVVIPSVRVVEPGEPGRVLVRYRPKETVDEPPAVTMRLTDEDGEYEPVAMQLDPRDDGAYFSKTYRVPGRDEGAVTVLNVSVDGLAADGLIEWRPRPEAEPVENIQFEHASYGVKDGAHPGSSPACSVGHGRRRRREGTYRDSRRSWHTTGYPTPAVHIRVRRSTSRRSVQDQGAWIRSGRKGAHRRHRR